MSFRLDNKVDFDLFDSIFEIVDSRLKDDSVTRTSMQIHNLIKPKIEKLEQRLREAERVIDVYDSLDPELAHIDPTIIGYFGKYRGEK